MKKIQLKINRTTGRQEQDLKVNGKPTHTHTERERERYTVNDKHPYVYKNHYRIHVGFSLG